MLTQPLAPRGPCDLREKAVRHWESMLAAMLGDMVSLGLPSSPISPNLPSGLGSDCREGLGGVGPSS